MAFLNLSPRPNRYHNRQRPGSATPKKAHVGTAAAVSRSEDDHRHDDADDEEVNEEGAKSMMTMVTRMMRRRMRKMQKAGPSDRHHLPWATLLVPWHCSSSWGSQGWKQARKTQKNTLDYIVVNHGVSVRKTIVSF